MSLETDLLLDRRRLKRRLSLWRGIAVLAVLAIVLVSVGRGGGAIGRPHVARVTITGIIGSERDLIRRVQAVADDQNARALLVEIDSPGGSVSGGEGLHDAIARVAATKPVVAVMGGTAASAGYMVALPAARIFAREATLTGSIGVLLETGEVSGLLQKLGITADAITSGPLKDQPSFTRPLTEQGREVLHGLVMDLYEQFVAMVAASRHMSVEDVRKLADGRAYTGRQALQLHLIDAIGDEREARRWLADYRGVSHDLPVDNVERSTWAAQVLGDQAGSLANLVLKSVFSQQVSLDGAWAIWQPGSAGE